MTERVPDLVLALATEQSTLSLGAALAQVVLDSTAPVLTVFLCGTLGAGKTTLSRGVMHALGHEGRVKSPTYTLVEPYELGTLSVFHFDLYRLGDPEELEYIGIRDYFDRPDGEQRHLCLVEWPQKAGAMLPNPDITVSLRPEGHGRIAELTVPNEKVRRQINEQFIALEQRT